MKSLFVVMALLLTGTAAQTKPPKVAWMPPFIAATESAAPTVPVGVDAIYVDSAHKWQCITNGGTPHECTDAEILHVLPKPEPMDVEAVKKEITKAFHSCSCSGPGELIPGVKTASECGNLELRCYNYPANETWTCADKSRILLTDEGGGKHCIKFTKEQP
jgi:hypothetical protein